jgi:hypothetical protein
MDHEISHPKPPSALIVCSSQGALCRISSKPTNSIQSSLFIHHPKSRSNSLRASIPYSNPLALDTAKLLIPLWFFLRQVVIARIFDILQRVPITMIARESMADKAAIWSEGRDGLVPSNPKSTECLCVVGGILCTRVFPAG